MITLNDTHTHTHTHTKQCRNLYPTTLTTLRRNRRPRAWRDKNPQSQQEAANQRLRQRDHRNQHGLNKMHQTVIPLRLHNCRNSHKMCHYSFYVAHLGIVGKGNSYFLNSNVTCSSACKLTSDTLLCDSVIFVINNWMKDRKRSLRPQMK